MDNCCRICRRHELKDCFSLNYQSDFHSKTGETVLEMLSFVTGLNVLLGDKLPQQLCRVCTATLVTGYELRNLCIESDTFFRQTLEAADDQKQPDQTDHMNDTESCPIKLELEIEDKRIDCEEKDLECNVEPAVDRFYCCFPNCSVNYQFEELLTEHAASDHHLEREANASNCNDSEFRCIVCARGFADEVNLLQHRIKESATLQPDSSLLLEKVAYGQNSKNIVCSCGYITNRTFSFNRHKVKCPQHNPHYRRSNTPANRPGNISDTDDTDRTNDEIMALGFNLNRNIALFYCCISRCATVCESQQQLCDHFQQLHPTVREENVERNYNLKNSVQCPICFTGFPTEKKLQIHLEDAYDPVFRCNTCRYSCTSRKNAIAHALVPCGPKMHRCGCGYSSPFTYALKRHMLSMGCPVEGSSIRNCNIKPRTKGKNAASKNMRYKCQNCESRFTRIGILRRHTESELSRALAKQEAADPGKQIDGSEQKQYTCCWCKTITDDSQHLVRCMVKAEKHTGEYRGYKCSNCNQKFKSYNQYLEHRNRKICLEKTAALTCKSCGVKFTSSKKLAKHMENTHETKVPHVPKVLYHDCKDCQRQFVTALALKRHRKQLHKVDETV